jgi:hypothetical protein
MGQGVDKGELKSRQRSASLATLKTLEKVREHGVEQASKVLAAAAHASRLASAALRAAHDATRAHARGVTTEVAVERKALEDGSLRAAELQAGVAWRRRVSAERDALVAQAGKAAEADARAAAEERRARAGLLARKVDADVARQLASSRALADHRASEEQAEEAQSEAWRPRGTGD